LEKILRTFIENEEDFKMIDLLIEVINDNKFSLINLEISKTNIDKRKNLIH